MQTQYEFVHRIEELFGLLQDEKSRKLFWDRMKYDITHSFENLTELCIMARDLREEKREQLYQLPALLSQLATEGKKILLYGTSSNGREIARALQQSDIPFDGFCGRHAATLKEILGKPVYSPEYLFSHTENSYVMITTTNCYDEIFNILKEHDFPQSHILPSLCEQVKGSDRNGGGIYYDFPEKFRLNTAFVDGGCCDALDSIAFSQWCHGNYSKIFAFEPDEDNVKLSKKNATQRHLQNFELIQAGLSDKTGTASFIADHSSASCFCDDGKNRGIRIEGHNIVEVPTVALDDIVQDIEVGFIKMDIEGSELAALRGAQNTIKRDKPLLAICVYHLKGDTLAIMDYLHNLMPEYRFWLRHYGSYIAETVLYAAIP